MAFRLTVNRLASHTPFTAGHRCIRCQLRKDIAEHIGTRRRQKVDATIDGTARIYREHIVRPQSVVLVALKFAGYGHVSVESVFECRLPDDTFDANYLRGALRCLS